MTCNNMLELYINFEGFLCDSHSNLEITKPEDIPTNLLLLFINGYYSQKDKINADIIAILEVDNYHVYHSSALSWSCFINNNCGYELYNFWGSALHKYTSKGVVDVARDAFYEDKIITEIKGPCIIYDLNQYFEMYEKSMITGTGQIIQNTPEFVVHDMENVAKIHEHFILKPIAYYNNSLVATFTPINVFEKCRQHFYIIDIKANFKTKACVVKK